MKCKTCGKEQHYCSSCGYETFVSDGYCNEECYFKSDEAKLFSKKLEGFWHSLTPDNKVEFWSLWDNGIFEDDKWYKFLDKLIIDPRDEEGELPKDEPQEHRSLTSTFLGTIKSSKA